jgi:nucleoside-diphosphate-sugar epimerase
MIVLVAGAHGRLGSRVVALLLRRGHEYSAPPREAPKVPIGQLGRVLGMPAVERKRRADKQGESVPLAAGKQRLGVLEPPLTPAQLGQPHKRVADHRWPERA